MAGSKTISLQPVSMIRNVLLLSELDTEAQRATVLNPSFLAVATFIAHLKQRLEDQIEDHLGSVTG
jgi:hypothetical protein